MEDLATLSAELAAFARPQQHQRIINENKAIATTKKIVLEAEKNVVNINIVDNLNTRNSNSTPETQTDRTIMPTTTAAAAERTATEKRQGGIVYRQNPFSANGKAPPVGYDIDREEENARNKLKLQKQLEEKKRRLRAEEEREEEEEAEERRKRKTSNKSEAAAAEGQEGEEERETPYSFGGDVYALGKLPEERRTRSRLLDRAVVAVGDREEQVLLLEEEPTEKIESEADEAYLKKVLDGDGRHPPKINLVRRASGDENQLNSQANFGQQPTTGGKDSSQGLLLSANKNQNNNNKKTNILFSPLASSVEDAENERQLLLRQARCGVAKAEDNFMYVQRTNAPVGKNNKANNKVAQQQQKQQIAHLFQIWPNLAESYPQNLLFDIAEEPPPIVAAAKKLVEKKKQQRQQQLAEQQQQLIEQQQLAEQQRQQFAESQRRQQLAELVRTNRTLQQQLAEQRQQQDATKEATIVEQLAEQLEQQLAEHVAKQEAKMTQQQLDDRSKLSRLQTGLEDRSSVILNRQQQQKTY